MPATLAPQLRFPLPFAVIAVCCDEHCVLSVRYLPASAPPLPPQNMLAAECARQLQAYVARPRAHRFELPLLPANTAYQQRVRRVVAAVAGGETMTYGDVARALGNSSPRAVGGACRANALPLIVPCHRIVAADGIGGFIGARGGDHVSIKKRLLRLEGAL